MNEASGVSFLEKWGELSKFGAVSGTLGVHREAASAADGQQRKWFETLMRSWGFRVERDAIGNLFALYEFHSGQPYVLMGSHLDSQPTAGRFDGAYGVLAAAFAAKNAIDDAQTLSLQPTKNIAVVNWFNEEGSRFKPSLMGSSVFTGKMELEEALKSRDSSGCTVREALDALGERGSFEALTVSSYAEIHVEQGRYMDEKDVTIGLVHATWAAHKFELRFSGQQAHSGSTLMEDRKDALLAAAQMIVAAHDVTSLFKPGQLHTAVGEIQVYPNSPVVVASEATILLDLRSPSTQVLEQAVQKLITESELICESTRTQMSIIAEHSWAQNPYQEEGVALAQNVVEELGFTHDRVFTIAGHDSTNMKDIAPTVMLFVPSVEGISHNVAEYTRDEDLLAGLDMLSEVAKRMLVGELALDSREGGSQPVNE